MRNKSFEAISSQELSDKNDQELMQEKNPEGSFSGDKDEKESQDELEDKESSEKGKEEDGNKEEETAAEKIRIIAEMRKMVNSGFQEVNKSISDSEERYKNLNSEMRASFLGIQKIYPEIVDASFIGKIDYKNESVISIFQHNFEELKKSERKLEKEINFLDKLDLKKEDLDYIEKFKLKIEDYFKRINESQFRLDGGFLTEFEFSVNSVSDSLKLETIQEEKVLEVKGKMEARYYSPLAAELEVYLEKYQDNIKEVPEILQKYSEKSKKEDKGEENLKKDESKKEENGSLDETKEIKDREVQS